MTWFEQFVCSIKSHHTAHRYMNELLTVSIVTILLFYIQLYAVPMCLMFFNPNRLAHYQYIKWIKIKIHVKNIVVILIFESIYYKFLFSLCVYVYFVCFQTWNNIIGIVSLTLFYYFLNFFFFLICYLLVSNICITFLFANFLSCTHIYVYIYIL